jgi:hypothetical protein
MKKLFSQIAIFTAITFCLHNCGSSREEPKQMEKGLAKAIVQHFNEKNHDAVPDYFTVPIGITNDKIEFKEDGKVYVQLGSSKQTFDITQLHQLHRLCDLKKIIQMAR